MAYRDTPQFRFSRCRATAREILLPILDHLPFQPYQAWLISENSLPNRWTPTLTVLTICRKIMKELDFECLLILEPSWSIAPDGSNHPRNICIPDNTVNKEDPEWGCLLDADSEADDGWRTTSCSLVWRIWQVNSKFLKMSHYWRNTVLRPEITMNLRRHWAFVPLPSSQTQGDPIDELQVNGFRLNRNRQIDVDIDGQTKKAWDLGSRKNGFVTISGRTWWF
jgi:hypothetical protein